MLCSIFCVTLVGCGNKTDPGTQKEIKKNQSTDTGAVLNQLIQSAIQDLKINEKQTDAKALLIRQGPPTIPTLVTVLKQSDQQDIHPPIASVLFEIIKEEKRLNTHAKHHQLITEILQIIEINLSKPKPLDDTSKSTLGHLDKLIILFDNLAAKQLMDAFKKNTDVAYRAYLASLFVELKQHAMPVSKEIISFIKTKPTISELNNDPILKTYVLFLDVLITITVEHGRSNTLDKQTALISDVITLIESDYKSEDPLTKTQQSIHKKLGQLILQYGPIATPYILEAYKNSAKYPAYRTFLFSIFRKQGSSARPIIESLLESLINQIPSEINEAQANLVAIKSELNAEEKKKVANLMIDFIKGGYGIEVQQTAIKYAPHFIEDTKIIGQALMSHLGEGCSTAACSAALKELSQPVHLGTVAIQRNLIQTWAKEHPSREIQDAAIQLKQAIDTAEKEAGTLLETLVQLSRRELKDSPEFETFKNLGILTLPTFIAFIKKQGQNRLPLTVRSLLGQMGPESIPVLLTAAKDPDFEDSNNFAYFGNRSALMRAARQEFQTFQSNNESNPSAIAALKQETVAFIVPDLLPYLDSSMQHLGYFFTLLGNTAVDPLLLAHQNKDEKTQKGLSRAFQLLPLEVIPTIISATKSDDILKSEAAFYGLEQLAFKKVKWDRKNNKPLGSYLDVFISTLVSGLSSTHSQNVLHAMNGLAFASRVIVDDEKNNAFDKTKAFLTHTDSEFRRMSVLTISELNPSKETFNLVQPLLKDPHETVRGAVLTAIIYNFRPIAKDAVPTLINLYPKHTKLQSTILSALKEIAREAPDAFAYTHTTSLSDGTEVTTYPAITFLIEILKLSVESEDALFNIVPIVNFAGSNKTVAKHAMPSLIQVLMGPDPSGMLSYLLISNIQEMGENTGLEIANPLLDQLIQNGTGEEKKKVQALKTEINKPKRRR